MPEPVIGIITIGQTPRPDLEAAFARHTGSARVEVRGALDGVATAEIDAAATAETEYPLIVRLADASTRQIPLDFLHPRVARCAHQLAEAGAGLIVVACAGRFPDLVCDVPVLLPGRILPAVARSVTRDRRIGVVTPIRAQARAALRAWASDGFDPVVVWASPYAPAEIDAAADRIRSAEVALVALDCFGHGEEYAREMAERTGKRVLAAQSVTARLAGELVRA